jgi:hypothetical protein
MTLEDEIKLSSYMSLDEIHRNELAVSYTKLCEIVELLEIQIDDLNEKLINAYEINEE